MEGAAEKLADGAVTVTQQAAGGNVNATLLLLILLAACLFAFWLYLRSQKRTPECDPPKGGCSEIKLLAAKIDTLSQQLGTDRTERKEHRDRVENNVSEIHRRIDEQEARLTTHVMQLFSTLLHKGAA